MCPMHMLVWRGGAEEVVDNPSEVAGKSLFCPLPWEVESRSDTSQTFLPTRPPLTVEMRLHS